MKNKIVFFFLMYFITVSITFYQPACPPEPEGGWESITTTFYRNPVDDVNYEDWGSVIEHYKRNIDGSIDVQVLWVTLETNYPYGLTDNEIKGFMYMAIIKDLLIDCSYPTIVDISFYEISDCMMNNPCYLKADQSNTVFCKDNMWPGPDPVELNDNGLRIWVILNKQHCGYKCCKTTYTVQCNNEHQYSSAPTILSSNQSVYYDCPATTQLDCYMHTPLECNSTCPLIQELP
jgi:hypothetical protein